jgi:uncharacterized membrane protein YqjE
VLELLARLTSALFRHLAAYVDLAFEEAGDAARVLRRQLLGLAVVLMAGTVALLMGCVWVIAAAWSGPYRMDAIGALCIGFVLIAAGGLWYANTGIAPGEPRPFDRLREEWREDLRDLGTVAPAWVAAEPTATVAELHVD